jgi:hypothetical protein
MLWAADAVAFKAGNERMAQRQVCQGLAVIQQFFDKVRSAPGIVRPDVVTWYTQSEAWGLDPFFRP